MMDIVQGASADYVSPGEAGSVNPLATAWTSRPPGALVPNICGCEADALRVLSRLMDDRATMLAVIELLIALPVAVGNGDCAIRVARALAMSHGLNPSLDPAHHGAAWAAIVEVLSRTDAGLALVLGTCLVSEGPAACSGRVQGAADDGLVRTALASLLRAFDTHWFEDGSCDGAIRRLAFLRDAAGLGVGLDPELVDGLRHGTDALMLVRAIQTAGSWPELRAKSSLLGHRALGRDRVGVAVGMLLNEDRRVHDLPGIRMVPA